MYTIWFRIPQTSGYLHTVVPAESSIAAAQEVWDRLAKQFDMLTSRP